MLSYLAGGVNKLPKNLYYRNERRAAIVNLSESLIRREHLKIDTLRLSLLFCSPLSP